MVAKSFRRNGLASALSLIAVAASFTPVAAFADTLPRAYVQTRDLDLTSPAGVAALDKRLGRAVRQVCPFGEVNIDAVNARHECMRAAWNGITPQRVAVLAAAERRPGDGAVALADIRLPVPAESARGF